MAKKIKETNITEDAPKAEAVVESVVAYNTKAFSIVFNGDKKYSVVEIPFDSATGNVGKLNVIKDNIDYYDAIDEFKKGVVKAGLFEKQ